MFSKILHVQLNISIYANSSYDLSFNLYPLKAGWQDLPEFDVKYNTNNGNGSDDDQQNDDEQNYDLQNLVNRWMPKRVFILVSVEHCFLPNYAYINLFCVFISFSAYAKSYQIMIHKMAINSMCFFFIL